MPKERCTPENPPTNEFESAAREADTFFLFEFVQFLKHNKKWWLLPILIVLVLISILTIFAGSPAAPFIYTLF